MVIRMVMVMVMVAVMVTDIWGASLKRYRGGGSGWNTIGVASAFLKHALWGKKTENRGSDNTVRIT